MTTSTDGILAYGHNLGEDWGFDDFQHEDNVPAWAAGEPDFIEAATTALLAANGFDDPEPDYESGPEGWLSWRRRRNEAEKQLPVDLVQHLSGEYPETLLSAKTIRAKRGYPQEVDFALPDLADFHLAWAVDVLDLERFKDQEPKWLLASWWG